VQKWAGMLERSRRRGADESGVVIVLVAVLMVVILGAAALAIDIGSIYKAQRQAQTAADAGALAASQDLPSSTVAATTDGGNYATTNYPGVTASVTTPYGGSPSQVKVTVKATTPSFFGQFFGLAQANVSATAVAGINPNSVPAAIFADNSSCSTSGGVDITGNNTLINGGVVSNGSLNEAGQNNALGPTSYGGPGSCADSITGLHNTFTSGPTADPTLTPFPIDYRDNPPACTFSGSNFSWTQNNFAIPDGVYCATGSITVTGNNMSGNVTFKANTVSITGNSESFTPYAGTNNLFIWQTGPSPMTLTGNTFATGGTIFAPSADVTINGNSAVTAFVEANDVTITGNNFTINGSGPIQTGVATDSLVQ
jgi:type II secretory pathway pseudopilin PulG